MSEIGVRELKLHTSAILRRIRENNESFEVTHRGRVIARIVPVTTTVSSRAGSDIWQDMDELAEEIAASWPSGVSAVEAVSEQRR